MEFINSIFVYGTLQPGKQYEKILKNLKGVWSKGYIFGKMVNIGFGSNYGYPAIKLNKKGSKIYGMILKSKNLKKTISKLDKFEGKDYKRVTTYVYLLNGKKLKAYIYQLKSKEGF